MMVNRGLGSPSQCGGPDSLLMSRWGRIRRFGPGARLRLWDGVRPGIVLEGGGHQRHKPRIVPHPAFGGKQTSPDSAATSSGQDSLIRRKNSLQPRLDHAEGAGRLK